MNDKTNEKDEDRPDEKAAAVTLPGTVEKIIPPITPSQPEKAQISVEGADDLYKEIRVENTLQDESGNEVALKKAQRSTSRLKLTRTQLSPRNRRQ
jgi:hypothetical protein